MRPVDYPEDFAGSAAEQMAKVGLDIGHYPFRWMNAIELAKANERSDDIRLLPFWERVRVLYLELGGEFIDGHRE